VLLCINGTGSLYRWVKGLTGNITYQQMNERAGKISVGSDALVLFPFGNGAERMLENKMPGASVNEINFNIHTPAHLYRAAQEGIAFAFRYGFDILKENGINPSVIRAGKTNMFLSQVFAEAFVNTMNVPVELYHTDGSIGAAIGAGIGAAEFSAEEAFADIKPVAVIEPKSPDKYNFVYQQWLIKLGNAIS
jgi:xylulokinase